MNNEQLISLINDLIKHPNETEWIEFKHNFHSCEEIGERISAIANSACLQGQSFGYLVFGVEDITHSILGTKFKAKGHKKGSEDLEHWLATRLNPRIDFSTYEFDYDVSRHISIYIIPGAINKPVTFLNEAYVRVGSITRKLRDFSEKESKIWRNTLNHSFEKEIAKANVSATDVIDLLSTQTYFEFLKLPYPSDQIGVIKKLVTENIIIKTNGHYNITKLGAVLLAKNLADFEEVSRKAVRVIVYKGKNKVETEREQISSSGYAVGFVGLIDWINGQLPANEEVGKALRIDSRMYPAIAIRELIANSLIHQDFNEKGFPMVEIFSDRVEISNPGNPLITPERFIDEYVSRNEKLADLMRRMGFCEEKGSGVDKVIFNNELYQLPAINILVSEKRTKVIIYSYRLLNDLDKKDKIRACYQHACLMYVSNDKMTNQSLRERFKIEDQNSATASRIIRDTMEDELIKEDDPSSTSRKYKKYIPFWA